MSRLRRGVHEVTVYPKLTSKGARGQLVTSYSKEGTTYRCNVHPVSTNETEDIGTSVATRYRITYFPSFNEGKPWVGGAYSLIVWNGRQFDQEGEAMEASLSPRTAHINVAMSARSSEVK